MTSVFVNELMNLTKVPAHKNENIYPYKNICGSWEEFEKRTTK